MGIPLRYNVRNLTRRKLRTALTVLGIALVISCAVIMLAYSRGLMHSMRNNGDPRNALILSRRATTREFSSFKEGEFDVLNSLLFDMVSWEVPEGGEVGLDELDLVAPYISQSSEIEMVGGAKAEGEEVRRGLLEGIDPERVPLLHDGFKIVEGRMLTVEDEAAAVVGSLAWARLGLTPEALAVGTTIRFHSRDWEIVGRFQAEGQTSDGEIWVPVQELQVALNRFDYGYAVAQAKDEAGMQAIVDFINRSEQTELRAVSEVSYYRGFAETFRTFAMIGAVMALVITLGGLMVGMNTMYTAVSGRIREVGLLQVQGFSKRSILHSFLMESLLIAAMGGALGCLLGSLVNGLPMQVTMGVFVFRVDAAVIAVGFGLALLIGLVGAWVPSRRALRLRMVDAMRYT